MQAQVINLKTATEVELSGFWTPLFNPFHSLSHS